MKNIITLLFLVLFSITGFSQGYQYNGRSNPTVKKEKLNDAKFITDISPVLWHFIALPYKDRSELDDRRKEEYSFGLFAYPQGGYNVVIDYVSVEISARSNGNIMTAKSTSDKLTAEQKNIITSADLGSDIGIKIKFKYKNKEKSPGKEKIIEGKLSVTIVPETEAEFPQGYKGITNYLKEHVINKISERGSSEKLGEAIVKFVITEDGQVKDVVLFQPTPNSKTDQLLLDAISKMPNWEPARNSKGKKVKQEYCISFVREGGC